MALSGDELAVLQNTTWFDQKRAINKKIIKQFGFVEQALRQTIEKSDFAFPAGVLLKAGKLSKGENYLGYPYFVLDYPRKFSQSDVFAFRTMLWWGHELSCTLHLQGASLERFEQALLQLPRNADYFCIHQSPWSYHFDETNYRQLSSLDSSAIKHQIVKNKFIKLSCHTPLDQLDNLNNFSRESLDRFLRYLD